MIDLLILLLLLAGLVAGWRRGFIVQVMHIASFIVALIVAWIYYKPLAQQLLFWVPYPGFTEGMGSALAIDGIDVDRTFYRVIAFAVIFYAVKIILQIITSMVDYLRYLPVLGSINRLLGAILGFIEAYLLIFILLYVIALLPIAGIQERVDRSILAGLMLEHTPLITSMFQHWWYIYTK